jgi:hypothetical protein
MSCRSATSRPCTVWRRIDRSPDTVVASPHSGVESPCTVVYPLHVTSMSALYCCHLDVSMSCTHLMFAIHHVWLVLYAFNALPTPRAWRGHGEPDVKHLGNARACLGGWEPWGMWRRQSPPAPGDGSGAAGHMATLDLFPAGWQAPWHGVHGDARALPHREVGLEPRHMWRHRSPSLPGGGPGGTWRHQSPPAPGDGSGARDTWQHQIPSLSGGVQGATGHLAMPELSGTRSGSRAMGHMATPEPFPVGWRARCHGHMVMP